MVKPGDSTDYDYTGRMHRVRVWKVTPGPGIEEAPLPLQDMQSGGGDRAFPRTWPKSWANLPAAIKEAWADEGIEDPQDLAGFYSSKNEVVTAAMHLGLKREEAQQAAGRWKDSRRGAGPSCSST